MILFHFFLIVTILFPVALGADSPITCTNETKIEGWKICCDGGIYNINDPISSVESCDVEPENANLSFADSAWLAYDCNVRNELNSTSLTLESYVNLMLPLHNSSRSKLWETFTSHINISEVSVGDDETHRIRTIKTYQSEYLQAAEQVCTFGYVNSTGVSAGMYWDVTQDFIKRFSSMILARECNEEMVPYSGYFAGNCRMNGTIDQYKNCKQEFNDIMGNVTFHSFRFSIYHFCQEIISQHLDTLQGQVRKPTLDFEGTIISFFPGFWSKWVKNSVKESMFEELNQDFKTQDLQNLESLLRNKIGEMINDKEFGTSVTNKRELLQAILILRISDVYHKITRNICEIDARRKGTAGV